MGDGPHDFLQRLAKDHPSRERRCSNQRGDGRGYDYDHGVVVAMRTRRVASGRVVNTFLCEGCTLALGDDR